MKKGFTLVELLVVISLIGILASLLIVSLQGSQKSARDGRRKADLEQIRTALEMYRRDTGLYPNSIGATEMETYLPQVPLDPSTRLSYSYNPNPSFTGYDLCTLLEDGSAAVAGCTASCGATACNFKVTNP